MLSFRGKFLESVVAGISVLPATAILVAGVLMISPATASTCDPSERLEDRIKRHEGVRNCVYNDQFGNPTIGVGHLLKKPVQEVLCWRKDKINAALAHDIDRAQNGAKHDFGKGWHLQPLIVQDVLTDMAFNLGSSGLARFNRFLSLVRSGRYQDAADDLLTTKYARQVPNRVNELACLLRSAK